MAMPKISTAQRFAGGILWAIISGVVWASVSEDMRPLVAAGALLGYVPLFWPQIGHVFGVWEAKTNKLVARLSAIGLGLLLALTAWTFFVWMPKAYYLFYTTCSGGIQTIPEQLGGIQIAVGFQNRNAFPIYLEVDDRTFTFETEAVPVRPGPKTIKIEPWREVPRLALATDELYFRRPLTPALEENMGHYSYTFKYGKDENNLDHRLTVSDTYKLRFKQEGEPEIYPGHGPKDSGHWLGAYEC